ncbi:hypothetical protein [Candidatus Nitrospira allomarina]|jgi:glucose-6-phosphate 1-dehydrogenase|uniref:Uncharacterized protein n=1 Tax=Candidatus Nitrospira allomarina TaxID=3020900 RepID=A0AA96GFQ7_9BACT|nr:hypothetical protein [Candidatus Nitrospira allomarina]WNM56936.1 hypothetical protein PP769_13240 [Candidatus Nitrospira allomarina]
MMKKRNEEAETSRSHGDDTRSDALGFFLAVVDSVLKPHPPDSSYKRGGWGPKEATTLIETDGGWLNSVSLQA